jgi:hypothetical protein
MIVKKTSVEGAALAKLVSHLHSEENVAINMPPDSKHPFRGRIMVVRLKEVSKMGTTRDRSTYDVVLEVEDCLYIEIGEKGSWAQPDPKFLLAAYKILGDKS